MDFTNPPDKFRDKQFYAAHFMDPTLWLPYVQRVCAHHGYLCQQLSLGIPGSYPTFIATLDSDSSRSSRSIVVKFFGPLYEGNTSFHIEKAMGGYLVQRPLSVRTPAILAQGRLSEEWYYLIIEYIPGESVGQVRQQLSSAAWLEVAYQLGLFMQGLHRTTATRQPIIPLAGFEMEWHSFSGFLATQRLHCQANHQAWHDLPEHLLAQIPDFLPPVDELLDHSSPPHLIHADLTADHLLGRLVNQEWQSLAIIDWGDTRLGNILYELVALHLDLFQAEKRLLRRCLQAYQLPDFYQQDFPRKALSMVLLHQFPMPAQVYAPHHDVATLDELSTRLFAV